jgi:hypothetical protein
MLSNRMTSEASNADFEVQGVTHLTFAVLLLKKAMSELCYHLVLLDAEITAVTKL